MEFMLIQEAKKYRLVCGSGNNDGKGLTNLLHGESKVIKNKIAVFLVLIAWFSVLPALADDLAIFGGQLASLKPNVLIVFDTSGSMDTNDVPPGEYDSKKVYSGSYSQNRIYYYTCLQYGSSWGDWRGGGSTCQQWGWQELALNASSIDCITVRDALNSVNYVQASLDTTSPYSCNSVAPIEVATGNYLNYLNIGNRRRIDVAKEAVTNLINTTEGIDYGLMVFNQEQGGRLVQSTEGYNSTTLTSAINGLQPNGYTPLAETLVEAGLYFAGAKSWFNTNTIYNSPIMESCQKNYIILMTDGEPTRDDDSNLCSAGYVNNLDSSRNATGDTIPGFLNLNDCSNQRSQMTLLDDVAKYLYDNDIRPDKWNDTPFDKQNIKTYVIGFKVTIDLLNDTAAKGGSTTSHSANNTSQLSQAFNQIIDEINTSNAIYVAPVIPPKPENQYKAGDRVYLSFFKPQNDGRWLGNLKGYKIYNGSLYDAYDSLATTANGYISATARSLWSTVNDGVEVDKGGVGALLAERDPITRTLYTYIWQENNHPLTHAKNSFAKGNNSIYFNGALGVASDSERDVLIDRVLDVPEVAGDPTWPLGSIIHSKPLIKTYHIDANSNGTVESGELKTYLFVGANDGMLHMFDTADGKETWGFVPPGQLPRLKLLGADKFPDYFVDGTPVMAEIDNGTANKILFFGERRGGDRYYALDLDSPTEPVWMYQITNNHLSILDWDADGTTDGAAATLGQSWATPQIVNVKSGGVIKKVFFLTGGYDTNQDASSPAATDSVGRALYTVKAEDGVVYGLNLNGALWPEMTHSIVDATVFDSIGRGYINRVYAGDLGGKLFAAKYSEENDNWADKLVLLNLPTQYSVNSVNKTLGRKFFTKPDVTVDLGQECVYAGTGDREDPLDESVIDAFYVACNKWIPDETTESPNDYVGIEGLIDPVVDLSIAPQDLPDDPLDEVKNKLVDVTTDKIQSGTDDEKALVRKSLETGSGWFVRMEHAGEKITSSPLVIGGKIYFTTFTPEVSTGDVCTTNTNLGTSRLYMLDNKTGMAAFDLNSDGSKTKNERSIEIGTSIAYSPSLITSGTKTELLYGAGPNWNKMPLSDIEGVQKYFWHQVK